MSFFDYLARFLGLIIILIYLIILSNFAVLFIPETINTIQKVSIIFGNLSKENIKLTYGFLVEVEK